MSGKLGRVGWACPKRYILDCFDSGNEGTAIREALVTIYDRHEVTSRST